MLALLPTSAQRAAARRALPRFLLMVERQGIRATLQDGTYHLDVPQWDSGEGQVEWASYHFWRLHHHLRRRGAPPEAFRSLSAHLWDMAWDAGGVTVAASLSYILLGWTEEEVRESLALRQPVFQPGAVPFYLRWIHRNFDESERPEVVEDLLSFADCLGHAFHDSRLRFDLVVTLDAVPRGKWQPVPDRLGGLLIEARDLAASLEERGVPLPSPLGWTDPPEQGALRKLRTLPGLGHIAGQVGTLIQHERLQALRRARGMPAVASTLHMAFIGNPGTGKTTVAWLVARALLEHQVLPGGQVVEVERAQLVGKYVGQTAPQVIELLQRAKGGVLLIDEAHSLVQEEQDSFGHEALNALVKGMEDLRGSLMVILYRYPAEMERLLRANPGLRSRIARVVRQVPGLRRGPANGHPPRHLRAARLPAHPGRAQAAAILRARHRSGETARGNARMVRALFEAAVERQDPGLPDLTDEDLNTLTAEDLGEEPAQRPMSA